jgi:hypothetical protein
MATPGGRKVLKARRLKGRVRLASTASNHVKSVNWNAAKAPAGRPSKQK